MAKLTLAQQMEKYETFIGERVWKGRSRKPFKSKLQVNTVSGIIEHPNLPGVAAFTFIEDDSYVRCSTCYLVV